MTMPFDYFLYKEALAACGNTIIKTEDLDALHAKIAELAGLLEESTIISFDSSIEEPVCWCCGFPNGAHYPDCRLTKALEKK